MLFQLALAPVLMCWFYIFIRDKYEKEPIYFLIISGIYGTILTFYVLFIQKFVDENFLVNINLPDFLLTSFINSAGIEELVKFIFLYFLVWRNKNFNEPFDGIVYAVFISIGFAAVENIIYVLNPVIGGIGTAISRGVFSVPGHGLFGVIMGFYFAEAKFYSKSNLLIKAFFMPWFIHSLYNLILLSGWKYYFIIFLPYFVWLWHFCLAKMKIHLKNSPFK